MSYERAYKKYDYDKLRKEVGVGNVKRSDIDRLKHRRDFLRKRISMSDKDLTYDKAEEGALTRVIEHLEKEIL